MKILLVEDNPGDIRLIVETISEGRLPLSVNVARDGEEAVKMITAGAFEPDIIMLDLELPRKSGLEVLEALRANEKTKLTPVIVLSSSESEADITRAYELHANCYVTKPINLDSFVVTINSINNFSLTTARRAK